MTQQEEVVICVSGPTSSDLVMKILLTSNRHNLTQT